MFEARSGGDPSIGEHPEGARLDEEQTRIGAVGDGVELLVERHRDPSRP